MPKFQEFQESFTGGEFAPMSIGQVSSEKYKKGLAACLNYIPTLQGPLLRRPGTKFVKTLNGNPNPHANTVSSAPPVLIPFIFSQTQSYMLEFGQQYINFYANNGMVTVTGSSFQMFGTNNSLTAPYFASRPSYATKSGEVVINSSVTSNSQFWVPTPYNLSDVPSLKWAQNADTLYLTHPNYPTFKLQRFGNYDWRLQQVYFQDGPYLAYNSYKTNGDATGITLQPGGSSWTGLPGALTVLTTGPHVTVANAVNTDAGYIEIVTTNPHGYVDGQNVVVQNIAGTTEANCYTSGTPGQPFFWNIAVTGANTFNLLGSKYVHTYIGGGDVWPSLFTDASCVGRVVGLQQGVVANAGQRIWGTIVSYTGLNYQVGFQIDPNVSLFNTSVSLYWQLGCYNGTITNGGTFLAAGSVGSTSFPASVCFHQSRLCFAGSPNYPQQIDASEIGSFEVFSPSVAIGSTALQVQTNNAFQYQLNSTDVNALQWMKSTANGLVSASYSNEWCITPSSSSESLSPTNVNAQQTSFFGAANVDAVMAGNAVLYIQRAQRKLREMNFFFQVGTYRSTDLTEISEHITLPTITKLAVQKETQPLVWAIRSDGDLVSMTYNRDDQAIEAGWARHQLGGRSDSAGTHPIVTSIATIPDPTLTYDQLWMVAERYMQNGSSVYSLEYMTNFFNDATLQEDAFQGDCGVTYDNPTTFIAYLGEGVITTNPVGILKVNHGYSIGDTIQFTNFVGLNSSVTDVNGNVTISNLLNEQTFLVGSSNFSVEFFEPTTFSGQYLNATGYSAYVAATGTMRKLFQTFSGAYWLTGETVGVLADGGNHPSVLVGSGGTFTLNYSAAKVQVGYTYNSQGQLLRSPGGSAQGPSIASTRRVSRAAAMLHNVGDWAWGLSFTNLISWNFTRVDEQMADVACPLFTGIIRDGVESGYDFEGQLCFQQNSMLPGVVQGIVTFVEEFDV